MYGYIYLTTNLINNKKYIGQHKSNLFDTKYKGSGKILQQAINKDGWDNFKCELLEECDSKSELDEREAYYIRLYNAVNSDEYYNLVPGGLGKSESGLIYITNGIENKKVHQEELDYYFSLGFYKGGPRQSQETKNKRANSNRGQKHPTAGAKISKALAGRKLSEEHKAKLSAKKKGVERLDRRVNIKCVELNIVFNGYKEISSYLKIKSASNVCTAIKKNKIAFGYHWELVN